MNTTESFKKFPIKFFILVFILAVPFWLLGSMSGRGLPLPVNLPLSALSFICPLIAALILVYRESKFNGIKHLLKRTLDYKKIKPKIWYVPIVFLLPFIYFLSYEIIRLIEKPVLGEIQIPFSKVPAFFTGFFISALCEEVGWTGYATDPMQNRRNALKASIVLGVSVGDISSCTGYPTVVWHGYYGNVQCIRLHFVF